MPADTQIDAQNLRDSAELIEILKVLKQRPAGLKDAILTIARGARDCSEGLEDGVCS
jgi:hypothetical protein